MWKPLRTFAIATVLTTVIVDGSAAAPARQIPHELTAADADAWLDGLMPYALAQADIAGAVIVIVKDGQVLTQRGFGYADVAARQPVDPVNTLFRPGSISKLFTWTAVMQLVEQGRIDLDADVNRYLDFQIPPFAGQPITMRNIMTHTSGFEDAFKGGIRYSGTVPPLGEVVKRMLPKRVFAPGSTPAYSNYATAVAGYIVERVSGMPYEDYIERNIFQPLGMTHSTFRQPLSPQFVPFMSKGYPQASVDAKPYELISVPPAGSATLSGADMAKFMIAQLNQGAGLMKPETAKLLHTPAYASVPGTNRMALGFYEQRINGRSAIGHGGDLNNFHSYLWLLPHENVGLFISMNSAGAVTDNFGIRLALFEEFADRYFPAADNSPPLERPTAREHAAALVGSYVSSRSSYSTFLDVANLLGQVKIGLDNDGRPRIPALFGGSSRHWVEVEPFVWQDAYGHERIGAKVENGKVVRWSIDAVSPFMVWVRAPWYRDATWLIPSLIISLFIVALTAFSWPVGAFSRRRFGASLALGGTDLKTYRLVRGFSWLGLFVVGGWAIVLTSIESDTEFDWPIWLLEITGTLGFFGLMGSALWNLWAAWKSRRGWFARVWSALLVVAALCILWVALAFHLISFGSQY
jgi:CubicO group peptidase (beta-lactamase class C family)